MPKVTLPEIVASMETNGKVRVFNVNTLMGEKGAKKSI